MALPKFTATKNIKASNRTYSELRAEAKKRGMLMFRLLDEAWSAYKTQAEGKR